MMTAYKNLGDELECPICKELFKVPKVMGRCLHVACLECLERLVAARGRTDFFPCPVCREKCEIPTQGVAALKGDFRLGSIVENYRNLRKDKDDIHCSACPIPASHFCKKCGKIYLCIFCSRKHSQDSLTAAHELVGVCSKHGKKLAMYCRKCGTAICSACQIADHLSGSQEHDVVPHQKIADEKVDAVAAAVKNLEATQRQKQNALFNVQHIHDSVLATIRSDLSLLGKQSDSVIEEVDKTRSDLIANRAGVKEQIKVLLKKEKEINEAIGESDYKIASIRRKNSEYSGYLNTYRDAFVKQFADAVIQIADKTAEIKAKVDRGRKVTSSKRVLDDQAIPSLLKIKEELVQTCTTAGQVDRVAQFVAAKEMLPRYVPASAPMEMGFIRRKVTTPNTSADVSFPADRPWLGLWNVRHRSDGRLSCLYKPRGGSADTKGAKLVLRVEKPSIGDIGDMRNIDIGVDIEKSLGHMSIERDESDNGNFLM